MEVIVGKIEGQIENMSQQLSRIEKLLMRAWTQLMDKLKPQQLISLAVGALLAWSALMFMIGLRWDTPDCSTCEEALAEQTKQYQACELDLFECSQAACEEVAELRARALPRLR